VITSKQIINISEEWDRTVKNGSLTADVYLNPTSTDLKEIYKKMASNNPKKEIRFIADAKDKKVYVWDASLAPHSYVSHSLGFDTSKWLDEPPFVFDGFGYLKNGYINPTFTHGTAKNISDLRLSEFTKSRTPSYHNSMIKEVEDFYNCNWSFIDKYIPNCSSFIDRKKREFLIWLKT
jgi:hypothetical protein